VVDLRLFKRRNFAAGSIALSIAYGLFFGNVVLLPLWLQQWMGYTSTSAGLALAPVGLLAILLTPMVGRKVGSGIRARWPRLPSSCLPWCCGCARSSPWRPTSPTS
jgi:hypothetical protein